MFYFVFFSCLFVCFVGILHLSVYSSEFRLQAVPGRKCVSDRLKAELRTFKV